MKHKSTKHIDHPFTESFEEHESSVSSDSTNTHIETLDNNLVTSNGNEGNICGLLCLNCQYTAVNDSEFSEHLELCYSSEPEFSCDLCKFIAKNKGGLTRHKNAQHQD